jgi:enamine deaminase RidA (YjgF/YER057c/UK114 family)
MARRLSEKLAHLGIELPKSPAPMGNYAPYVVSGGLVYISGQGPRGGDGTLRHIGKLGSDLGVIEGQEAARLCAINLLGQLRDACDDDLDRVRRVIKLGGFVNSTSDFVDHPKVLNGASDLMVAVFGDVGRHARFAVGAASLPGGMAVEIDGLFEIF